MDPGVKKAPDPEPQHSLLMLQRVDVALRHAGRVAGVRAARLHLRHTRQGQRRPGTGRGMRHHVLNGWEHVIVDECHATGRESMSKSGLPDSCFVTNIRADKYMNRTRHAPAPAKWMGTRDPRRNFMPLDGKAWIRVRVA